MLTTVQILIVSILGSVEGVKRAATEGGGGDVAVVIGGVDASLGGKNNGMIVPGYVTSFPRGN